MNTKNGLTHSVNKLLVGGFIVLVLLTIAVVVFAFVVPSAPQSSLGSVGSGVGGLSQSNVVPQAKMEDPGMTHDGTWSAEMNGARFDATVADQVITITVTNNDTTMVYWCGSFVSNPSPGNIVTSTRIELDKAVLSTAASKTFQIRTNSLVFEFTMMGKTENVELVRN